MKVYKLYSVDKGYFQLAKVSTDKEEIMKYAGYLMDLNVDIKIVQE